MLSKEAHTILKVAKDNPEKKIAYLELKERLNWDYDKVKSAGNQLVDKGLAVEKYYSPMPGSSVLWGIVLTEEGRNSKQYFWANVGNFLFKSIAVPIVVAIVTAIVTTLITLWIQRLFPVK